MNAPRLVIAGNLLHGVGVSNGAWNTIAGNYIGTDASGAVAKANGGNGVAIESGATGNAVGSGAVGAGNVIGGNAISGISLAGAKATGWRRP